MINNDVFEQKEINLEDNLNELNIKNINSVQNSSNSKLNNGY